MKLVPLVLVPLALLALPLVGGEHPEPHASPGGVCLGDTFMVLHGPVYLLFDSIMNYDLYWTVFVYAETNSVDGLQRHDSHCYTPGFNSDALADLMVL